MCKSVLYVITRTVGKVCEKCKDMLQYKMVSTNNGRCVLLEYEINRQQQQQCEVRDKRELLCVINIYASFGSSQHNVPKRGLGNDLRAT